MPRFVSCLALLLLLVSTVRAEDPLHVRVDALITAANKNKPHSPVADDAEFLRRSSLDLIGTIPTASVARTFLGDATSDKRTRWIDTLLASPEHTRRMQDVFHLMLMERLGDYAGWSAYLKNAFAKNRPWDVMAADMLRGRSSDDANKGATFFLSKRLENYGQNPVDYPALARDVGRFFLGKDLRCAQCHDHLFIDEYKQADFQGLFLFIENAVLQDGPNALVAEKPLVKKREFQSVLTQAKREIWPRLPGGKEISVPTLTKEQLYLSPPDPRKRIPGVLRFSVLEELAKEVPANPDFSRNIANRVWWLMMGRGLVHPLDLHHKGNLPSHPEVLDLLARELVAHKYDLRWLVRELALTKTYQRSSKLPEGETRLVPERFLTAIEKRLSAEQMLWSVLEVTGEKETILAASQTKAGKATPLELAQARFVKAFAGPQREPEEDLAPSLKGALLLLNDPAVLAWLQPRPGNLVDRLSKLEDAKVADELYLSVLTRRPDRDEATDVAAYLRNKTGKTRTDALGRLAWSLLASAEFMFNH